VTHRPENQVSNRNLADLLLDALDRLGVGNLFLVPGAQVDPLVCAAARHPRVRPVVCAHELGAAFMADGHARMTGGIGACASIGGPGAANLIPGATTARVHDIPVLYLTGMPPAGLRNASPFQDTGERGGRDAALFQAALGHSETVIRAAELPDAWARVLSRLAQGSPSHLAISYDAQLQEADLLGELPTNAPPSAAGEDGLSQLVEQTHRLLKDGARLAILAGPGLNTAAGRAALRELAEQHFIPVATTADAVGILPGDHPLWFGHFGYGGGPRATDLLLSPEVESLLVVGAELNERNSLAWHEALFAPERRILQVHARPQSAPPSVREFHFACAPPERFLGRLGNDSAPTGFDPAAPILESAWFSKYRSRDRCAPLPADAPFEQGGLHPAQVVAAMRRNLPADAALFVDSGAHRLAANLHWTTNDSLGLVTAAQTAPTGWAIAAGIGAALAGVRRRITVLTGDGCMLMHGMELCVAARNNAPVTFVLSNNSASGNIYRRLARTVPEAIEMGTLPRVDWTALALALGVRAVRITSLSGLDDALNRLPEIEGPCLLEVITRLDYQDADPAHSFSSCSATMVKRLRTLELQTQAQND
jgi:acetolactate synthase-1/2/3 large subunit